MGIFLENIFIKLKKVVKSMKVSPINQTSVVLVATLLSGAALAETVGEITVSDALILEQRNNLAANSIGSGYGPQSPRDIDVKSGANIQEFSAAPPANSMNICNIHFHENAEHRGGQFTTFAGNGDGHGNGTGYKYNGALTSLEKTTLDYTVGKNDHGGLEPGDTIEIHFVHSTADVKPGATLSSCITDEIMNPQLRVETVVAVLVNDTTAASFTEIAEIKRLNGYFQAPNIPEKLGMSVTYSGSTTGPSYNEKSSSLQVTWNVRPNVLKLDIGSVAVWLADNPFDEDYAHGVRNLILNPNLLSPID